MEPTALEQVECKILCQAIQDAFRYLDNGDSFAGRRCLMVGLERAEEFVESGETWAEDLAQTYRDVLFQVRQYCPPSQRVPMTPRPWL